MPPDGVLEGIHAMDRLPKLRSTQDHAAKYFQVNLAIKVTGIPRVVVA